jgi:hypothetical protein
MYGAFPLAYSPDHSRVVLLDQYLLGDSLLYEPDRAGGRRVLHGTPPEQREEGRDIRSRASGPRMSPRAAAASSS